ncbi:hypothetical protein VC83_05682 [Pseudogymnoascus destructans]|uniref:Uncharacterized protein n=1 Tax=Pseudogymnoascus destructans TaxID=655981 RepID=A0A177A6L7_9PEZI|nr:uncharacterized protein VC83_05682 [Pseudogymnoascus destructans]OAF57808.1 hypothetical protein VC83_05682 [Pseudogymnoascus destructans]
MTCTTYQMESQVQVVSGYGNTPPMTASRPASYTYGNLERLVDEGSIDPDYSADVADGELSLSDGSDVADNPNYEQDLDEAIELPLKQDLPLPDMSNLERVTEFLCEQFTGDFGGCSEDAAARHATSVDGYHHPLLATLMDVAPLRPNRTCGISGKSFPAPNNMPVSEPKASNTLRNSFEGLDGSTSQPKNICIHLDDVPTSQSVQGFDLGSYIVFLSSFAVFCNGFHYNPCRAIQNLVKSDLHIKRRCTFHDSNGRQRQQLHMLKDTPHAYISHSTENHHRVGEDERGSKSSSRAWD